MKLQSSCSVPGLIPLVASWLYNQWGRHLPNRSIDTAVSALRQPLDSEGLPFTLIAVDAGEPVGVARLVKSDLETKPDLQPWLASVFVPIHHRKQGIGTFLCSGVIEHARKSGFSAIYLYTTDRVAFYERQGWSVMGHEKHRDMQVTLMKLEIREQVGAS
jgi:predicted N-acetyltransferase YhbS